MSGLIDCNLKSVLQKNSLAFNWCSNKMFPLSVDHRHDDAFYGKLDSSLKKNTAFVKKLVRFQLKFKLNAFP